MHLQGDERLPLLASSGRPAARLHSIDLLRGAIMVVMAWDHTKDFVSKYSGHDGTEPDGSGPFGGTHTEFWYGPQELYHGSPVYFFARFVSHFCAPGFALLMGTGMVLLSISRRSKAGWGSARLLRFFCLRGVVLVALGFVVRASTWIELISPNHKVKEMAGDDHPFLKVASYFFQVMTSLGLQMIVLSFILAALHAIEHHFRLHDFRVGLSKYPFFNFGFQPTVLFVLGVLCQATTTIVIHNKQDGHSESLPYPGEPATAFKDVLVRFLVVPGPFGHQPAMMAYPIIPWLALSCWGAAMGFEFRANSDAAHRRALVNGLLLLACFALIRTLGGAVLNLRGYPMGEESSKHDEFVGFWSVCKYPPSLAYCSLTVGVDLVCLFLFSLVNVESWPIRILLTYGRSPLAFYLVHFYAISTFALIIHLICHCAGVVLPAAIPIWLTVVGLMFIVCHYYGRFKHSKGPDSLWRLL
eukprot:m.187109 g.187109  ORF g.187109 m.187109 type:complete len:470 (-) comp10542_c0_seq1:203-1612(-)